jgi:hypothetical protein
MYRMRPNSFILSAILWLKLLAIVCATPQASQVQQPFETATDEKPKRVAIIGILIPLVTQFHVPSLIQL